MGVHDLWKLLKPCGTVIDLATLQGKTLAIDASIWLVQFLKAMRDEETGQMTENAHLIGSIGRICKLLYYRIKPVFVFDGGVPLLKMQVMRNRRNKTQGDESRRQKALRRMLANKLLTNGMSGVGAAAAAAAETTTTTTTTTQDEEEEEHDDVGEEEEQMFYRRRTYYKLGEFQATSTLHHNEFSQVQLTQFLLDARKKNDAKQAKLLAASMAEQGSEQTRKLLMGDDTLEYTLVLDPNLFSSSGKDAEAKKLKLDTTPVAFELNESEHEEEAGVQVVENKRESLSEDKDVVDNKPVSLSEDEDDIQVIEKTNPIAAKESKSFAAMIDEIESEAVASLFGLLEGVLTIDSICALLWGALASNTGEDNDNTLVGQMKRQFVDNVLDLLEHFGNTEENQALLFTKYSNGPDNEESGSSLEFENVSPAMQEEEEELEFEEEASPVAIAVAAIDEAASQVAQEAEEEEELEFEDQQPSPAAQATKQPSFEGEQAIDLVSTQQDSSPTAAVVQEEDDEPEFVIQHTETLQMKGTTTTAAAMMQKEDDDEPEFVTQHAEAATVESTATPQPAARNTPQQFPPPASYLAAAAAAEANKHVLEELDQAKSKLKSEHNRAARDADTVTPEMKQQVMDLLDLFGLPYVQSPMEAEAQCAALELAGKVDGVVTEDSDVFLFGARHVYKNIFSTDSKQQISAFFAEDIEQQLSIKREQMISLAMLLGSDYTEGVTGIGIVNAVEVLNAFPNLESFREWVETGTLKEEENDAALEFKLSHANARVRWAGLSKSFPDPRVREAYEHPNVLEDVEEFEYREPNVEAIRKLCLEKLRMPLERVEKQVLEPIVARKPPTQTTLDGFVEIKGKQRFAAIRSKRMAKAVEGLKRHQEVEEEASIMAVDDLGRVVSLKQRATKDKT